MHSLALKQLYQLKEPTQVKHPHKVIKIEKKKRKKPRIAINTFLTYNKFVYTGIKTLKFV